MLFLEMIEVKAKILRLYYLEEKAMERKQ